MSSSGSNKQETVAGYQLRFRIVDVQPIVWRRLLLRADNTLEDLHYAIQICCNWSDDYLHQFKIYGQRIRPTIFLSGSVTVMDNFEVVTREVFSTNHCQ